MKKSRIASPVPHPESYLHHLSLVDLLVNTKTERTTYQPGTHLSLIRPMG